MPNPPSEEQILDWFEDLSNWGRWGDDDRLGTLNHLTAAKRVSAAGLVREGLSISCSWDIRTGQQPGATVESQRYMLHILTTAMCSENRPYTGTTASP